MGLLCRCFAQVVFDLVVGVEIVGDDLVKVLMEQLPEEGRQAVAAADDFFRCLDLCKACYAALPALVLGFQVFLQLGLASLLGYGTYNDRAVLGAYSGQELLQACPFGLALDLTREDDLIAKRHQDEVAS